jgi:uncharacterized protein YciI
MQFLVTGRDSTDADALDRRMAARPAHIEACDALFKNGTLLFGVALKNDEGTMIGSAMVFDVPSRASLDELLAAEPYVQQGVWESFDVEPCQVGPTFLGLFEK